MKSWRRQKIRQRASIAVIAMLFAAVGIYFTFRLLAAPIGTIVEVEQGTLTPPAQKVPDADAAGQMAVRFAAVTPPPTGSTYNAKILADNPVLFLPMVVTSTTEKDESANHAHNGTYKPGLPGKTTMPNGDPAAVFNGTGNYLEVADANDLSTVNKGYLTIEAWMRPDVLNFPRSEAEGYVHWMGKGVPGQHEYVSRIYNKASGRPNRISGYAYNLGGGLGAGSYFEDALTAGQWIHYTVVTDIVNLNGGYGTIRIYKNGVLRDQDSLGGEYNIHPANGTAPFRVGTRDLNSFFQGAIGKVAIYNYALSAAQISAHYQAMK